MNPADAIDLTMPLRKGMRGVDYEECRSLAADGWNARNLHLYSHAGTHMDAQTHFGAGQETIDRLPLKRCMGPAWVVRLNGIAPSSLITPNDLGDIARRFKRGESLLLHTGWSAYEGDPAIYRDSLPRISESLALWCAEYGVRILGVEPPSVADVNQLDEVTHIHRILLGSRITIVEGLTRLDRIPGDRCFFAAFPLPIVGGDGCPCRAMAWPET
jgi:arylformamidase